MLCGDRGRIVRRGVEGVGGQVGSRGLFALGVDEVVEVGPGVVIALVRMPWGPRVGSFADATMADARTGGVGMGVGRVRDVEGA
jgi:hypothetical protein